MGSLLEPGKQGLTPAATRRSCSCGSRPGGAAALAPAGRHSGHRLRSLLGQLLTPDVWSTSALSAVADFTLGGRARLCHQPQATGAACPGDGKAPAGGAHSELCHRLLHPRWDCPGLAE